MNCLEERILKDGIVKEGNVLKVDSFLNHQMDIDLFNEMGKEWKKRFDLSGSIGYHRDRQSEYGGAEGILVIIG